MIKGIIYVAPLAAMLTAVSSVAQQTGLDNEVGPLDQVVPVADEEPKATDATIPVDNEQLDEQRLAREFERYRRLVNEGAMDEADTSAKRIVEMAIRIYGPQSHETSKALNNLALVQNKNGQYEAAIQNFESAIEIIEILEDRLNDRLVNPLKGLGSAQLGNGRPDLALKTFNRATHITHVNEGPHNIEQVEILESIAESTLRMGDAKGARSMLDRIHVLNVRHFENNELALLPSLMRRADWQHRAGYYNDERATYRRAIRIVEVKLGKNDPQLIYPLRKLGQSFYFLDLSQSVTQHQSMVATGEMYFKRAAKIADQSKDVGWRERAETKLGLADHYIFVESYNRARKIYDEVWADLSGDEDHLSARAELLEQPNPLLADALPTYISPPSSGTSSDAQFLTGTIRVDYSVSPRGRVRNIRTEAIPPEFTDMQRIVHREMRRRIFRPQMSNGEITESDSLVFEHSFLYRQADLDKLAKPKESSTPQTTDNNPAT